MWHQSVSIRSVAVGLTLSLLASGALAQQASSAEYVYRARAGDTLIGFGQRALNNPSQWRALQRRNGIANPQRIAIGTPIRVPQDWLRQSAVSAEVLQTIGSAQVDGRPLVRGELLAEGVMLTTGADGFVTLRFADGGLLILQADSRLLVARMRRYDGIRQHDTQVRLEAGRAHSQLTPSPAVGRFEIATPVAVSAVRGTEFRTQFDGTRTLAGAEVTQGLVGVTGSRSGAVSVPAGFGATTDASGQPSAPVRLLPAPELVSPPTPWSTATLELALKPVPNAVEYRAQLARDELLREIIAQSSSADPLVRFNGLSDGDYWLRVQAVDAKSLVGLDRIQPLRIALLPEPPKLIAPAAGAKHSSDSTELSWQPNTGPESYRLQLARDAEFGDLLVDEERLPTSRFSVAGLAAGVYHWRVAALHADGRVGEWSAPRHFEQKAAPPAPQLLRTAERAVTITWTHKAGETHRLQVSRDPNFATTSIDLHADHEQHQWRASGPGTYHVRVQTIDADGDVGPWSAASQIELPSPRWVRWMPLVSVVPLLLL